jgi:hypothetical protein
MRDELEAVVFAGCCVLMALAAVGSWTYFLIVALLAGRFEWEWALFAAAARAGDAAAMHFARQRWPHLHNGPGRG